MTARPLLAAVWLGAMTVACGPSVNGGDTAQPDDTAAPTDSGDESVGESGIGMTTGMEGTTTADPPMTSTGSTGEDDGSDDSMGSGFIYGGADTNPSPQDCDLELQDCPRGDKCMPWANDGGDVWNASRCSPVAEDPGQPGDPCTVEGNGVSGIDDCDLGLMCFFVDPKTNAGECRPLCGASLACEDPDHACAEIVQDLSLCLAVCDPTIMGCPEGQACEAAGDESVCVPASE